MKESSRKLFPVALEPCSAWIAVFNSDTADSGVLIDPYDDDRFLMDPQGDFSLNAEGTTRLSLDASEGGRVLTSTHNTGRLDIVGWFSDPAATATVQVFGFDWIDAGGVPLDHRSRLVVPSATQKSKALGIPYAMTRDIDGDPQSITITPLTAGLGAETAPLSVTDSDDGGIPLNTIYPNLYTGTTRYCSGRHIFETSGLWGFFFWVSSISSGSLVLAARTV